MFGNFIFQNDQNTVYESSKAFFCNISLDVNLWIYVRKKYIGRYKWLLVGKKITILKNKIKKSNI